jgi:hypothetical protein
LIERGPQTGPEVARMGTDWFIKAECPRPNKEAKDEEEHIKACSGCPFVIWEKPESVAGFMSSMCGVRVGSIGMAAKLDDIGEELTGIVRFTKQESSPSIKLEILQKIKAYTQEDGWSLPGFSQEETLERLEKLIKFCERAEKKELAIHSWA